MFPANPVRLQKKLSPRARYGDLRAKFRYDYYRTHLPSRNSDGIYPEETVHFNIEIPAPATGSYHMVFDLVSENVSWFVNAGSKEIVIELSILQ